jgi:cytidyltransferase-like protein
MFENESMKKKFAITVGVFDCLHEGHVNLLRNMREAADESIVIIHDDLSTFENKGRFPVQTNKHRIQNLRKSGLVDDILCVDLADPSESLKIALSCFIPSSGVVYMRGDDWADFPGRKAVLDQGVEIRLIPYTEGVSTTQIRNDLKA